MSRRAAIKAAADAAGESVNVYINRAVEERMERENAPTAPANIERTEREKRGTIKRRHAAPTRSEKGGGKRCPLPTTIDLWLMNLATSQAVLHLVA